MNRCGCWYAIMARPMTRLLLVRSQFPSVEVLELGRNLGFAAGMNAGIRHALAAGAEQVLLLNNDTIVDQLMVERLVAHSVGDVGLVAPLIFYGASQI